MKEAKPPSLYGSSMRKLHFTDGDFYHIFNRGVDKRKIFLKKQDYFRFIHDLFEFNDLDATINVGRKFVNFAGGLASSKSPFRKVRKLLVNIICFCLMPNHFHLILKQIKKEGITKFMQKLGTGYTMYFNQEYERTGSLFEGPFKSIFIEKDEYLVHLSRYIHLNPAELKEPDYKEKGINDWESVGRFLEEYKWSSYLDYLGKHNFPSLINKKPLLEYFKNENEYKKFVYDCMTKDIEKISDLTID